MDRLTSMAVFVRAADSGSFAAAAATLDLSPQMVAKHVAGLEIHLGARLIARTTRRQSLTEIGRTYYERCKVVLAEVEWADSLAEEAGAAPRGRLRVNAPVSFGSHSLIPMITRYLREHPGVEIDLVLNDREVDLVEEGFEAVFRIGPLPESGLIARSLAPFRLVACASPAYLCERTVPEAPEDLAAHDCLGYTHSGSKAAVWRFVRDGTCCEVAISARLLVNNAMALLTAALDGFGIALIAEDLAREPLRDGRLVAVLPDHAAPVRPIHLINLADRRQTPKLRSFVAASLAAFGPRRKATSAKALDEP